MSFDYVEDGLDVIYVWVPPASSIVYPSSPTPVSVRLSSFQPSRVSNAHNLRRIRRSRGAQRWLLELEYPPLSRAQLAPLFAFAMKQDGQAEEFDLTPAIFGFPQGSGSGSPTVTGTQTAGTTTIPSSNWPIVTTVLKAGDIIRFTGHNKVYMVVEDVDTDASGDADILIRPALVENVLDTEDITYTDVPMQCTFTEDTLSMLVTPGDFLSFSVQLIETL